MKLPPGLLPLAVLLAVVAGGQAAHAQTPLYTANTTTATPESGAVHFLQMVNLNLVQGPGTYSVASLVIGLNFTSGDTQQIQLVFYTDVDTNPNSADALASATPTGAAQSDDTPPGAGNYAFTYLFTDDNPLTITAPASGMIGVEFALLDANGASYSATANGRFTNSAPTVGTAAGFVWNDSEIRNVFTGAQQTRFGMTNANVRFALTGTLIKPAPSVRTYVRRGTVATLTVDSYNGVNYQLQRATSLVTSDWTNVGAVVAGSTGTVLTFADDDRTDPQAFYRIVGSVPAQSGSSARKLPGRGRVRVGRPFSVVPES